MCFSFGFSDSSKGGSFTSTPAPGMTPDKLKVGFMGTDLGTIPWAGGRNLGLASTLQFPGISLGSIGGKTDPARMFQN